VEPFSQVQEKKEIKNEVHIRGLVEGWNPISKFMKKNCVRGGLYLPLLFPKTLLNVVRPLHPLHYLLKKLPAYDPT